MKKIYTYINSGWQRQWLLAVLMLFAVGAQAEEYSKTYDFSSFQYGYDAQVKSGYIIMDGVMAWNFDSEIEPVNSNGMLFRGVTSKNIYIQGQEHFTNIHSVVITAGAAPGADAPYEDQTVYLNGGASTSIFMDVTPSQIYQNNSGNLNLKEYVFEPEGDEERVRIDFSTYYEGCADVLIKEVTVYYSDEEDEPEGFDLWVDDVQVTMENMGDIKGDSTVCFDGNKRLTLNNAKLSSIFSALPDGLEVYLKGQSEIVNQDGYAIFVESWHEGENGEMAEPSLTFMTNCNKPGVFIYDDVSKSTQDVPDAFRGVVPTLRDNLAASLDKQASVNLLTIAVPLQPIVDDNSSTSTGTETHIDYTTNPGSVETADLSNFTYRNVLYTLHDTQNPNVADDGFANGEVVLNSTMSDYEMVLLNGQVSALDLIPGTTAYAENYKGLTFVVPAGTGTITVNSETAEGYEFHVKIGNQEPVVVVNKTANGGADYEIPYAVSKATYVYLYLTASTSAAPQQKGPRIGPKSTVSGGLRGLGVSGNNIATPHDGSETYLLCTGDMLYREANGGITVTNPDVTDIDANTFAAIVGAPRHASGYDDIPFIDLTQTAIVGKDVSRYSGAFEGFPEQTFIYMPAGNTSTEPNVIIAGVCEDMRLVGISGGPSFALPSGKSGTFIASSASYLNSFMPETPSVVCLPYALETAGVDGTFFEYDSYDTATTTVKMKAINPPSLDANQAYVFAPSSNVVSLPDMTNVSITKAAKESNPSSTTEATGLHGVFKSYNSVPSGVYLLDGAGNKFTQDGTLAPFTGYLRLPSAPSQVAIEWWGLTVITPLSADQVRQDADGWYTITGFRLPAMPTQKGVYIHNGRKVTK